MKHVSGSDLRRTFAESMVIPLILLVVGVSRLALSQVPPATALWYVGPPFNSPTNSNYFGTNFPINLTVTTNIPGVVSHTATVYTYPGISPSVGASASASTILIGSQGLAYRVVAEFEYNFRLEGPAGQNVPINFSATGNTLSPPVADANYPPYAIAQVRFWEMGPPGNVYFDTTVSNNNTFSIFQQNIEIVPNQVNALYLRAEVYVGGSSSPTPTGSASADPSITIDPSFAQADQYTIVWSPNLFQVGFSSIAIAGNNLVFNATNGAAEGTYILLTSTNLTIPFSDWSPVTTNTLESSGNFSMTVTNAVSSNTGQKYFTLKLQ